MDLVKFEAPSWLDRTAKDYWRRVSPALADEGRLTLQTADLLACAASAFSAYREAAKNLKEQGRVITTHTGAMKVNPWLAVEKQAFETMARVYKELSNTEKTEQLDYGLAQFLEGKESS